MKGRQSVAAASLACVVLCVACGFTRWRTGTGAVELLPRNGQVVVPKKMLAEISDELSTDATTMATLKGKVSSLYKVVSELRLHRAKDRRSTVYGYGANGTWKPCISGRRSIFEIGSHTLTTRSLLQIVYYTRIYHTRIRYRTHTFRLLHTHTTSYAHDIVCVCNRYMFRYAQEKILPAT